MNFKTKNTKTRAAVTGGLALAMLLSGTFAFFTDRASFIQSKRSGVVDIEVSDTSAAGGVIIPGASIDVTYDVSNKSITAGKGIDVRETVLIYALDDNGLLVDMQGSVGVYKETEEDELGNVVGKGELATKEDFGDGVVYVTEEYRMLDDAADVSRDYKLVMDTDADNALANYTYYVGVLVEAKQVTSASWTAMKQSEVVLGVAKIASGTESGFATYLSAVVPLETEVAAQSGTLRIVVDDTASQENFAMFDVSIFGAGKDGAELLALTDLAGNNLSNAGYTFEVLDENVMATVDTVVLSNITGVHPDYPISVQDTTGDAIGATQAQLIDKTIVLSITATQEVENIDGVNHVKVYVDLSFEQ